MNPITHPFGTAGAARTEHTMTYPSPPAPVSAREVYVAAKTHRWGAK